MTLTELQEMAIKQQQQIEINQQLLLAKEKRLKQLKVEEQKNQQLSILTQSNLNSNPIENSHKLENLKQNVLSQELKIFKLKQLRNQILEYKLSNSNMYSELDLIRSLFSEKERELYKAISKVSELTKQIDQLRKIKSLSSKNQQFPPMSNLNVSELDKLKQELQIRNKLNEQQSKKILTQHELFNKKQIEVLALDKRIEELKSRISTKRNKLNEMSSGEAPAPTNPSCLAQDFSSILLDQQQGLAKKAASNEAEQIKIQSKPATPVAFNELDANGKNSQSPSKLIPKFATKQEIANTYMNKFGSEAYQKYQLTSMRLLQQQSTTTEPGAHVKQISNDETSTDSTSTSSNTNLPSSSSSLVSLSPISNSSNVYKQQMPQPAQNNAGADASTLPSHLKLEFDKIKYLPDMVKTIKKRHSISEVEGSSNSLPPQIFQKILEKHHKNFLDQQHQQQLQAQAQQPAPKLNKIKEESNEPVANNFAKSFNSSGSDLFTFESSNMSAQTNNENNNESQSSNESRSISISKPVSGANKPTTVFLSTFMPQEQQNSTVPQVMNEMKNNENQPDISQEVPEIISFNYKSQTKSIIKQTGSGSNVNNMTNQGSSELAVQSRRVNFDPHALLLDAAVEGEIDLVVKCAKQVKDISEPNDEGITAVSIFEIVLFFKKLVFFFLNGLSNAILKGLMISEWVEILSG